MSGRLHLRLPATSANLGPGFDAVGLALTLSLRIEAEPAEKFIIEATGRNAETCASLERNLLLDSYRRTLTAQEREIAPLRLRIHNEIPIGMGCGSSAAARLAGVALAAQFGGLEWDRNRILTEASLLEGHPDNTAACWLGGFTVAVLEGAAVHAVSLRPGRLWRILLALPERPLSTTTARGVLPQHYSRADAVANIQRSSLLTAAFASGRGDLLRLAMKDRIHQPYRESICPLLPALLPMAGSGGVLGVALSGAGPGVLLLLEENARVEEVRAAIQNRLEDQPNTELLECSLELEPAKMVSSVTRNLKETLSST